MLPRNTPIALSIAGSDSGGEAGIQADLKTFAALKVHGTTAITCLTAQNASKISRLEPCSPAMLRAQLEAVASHFAPGAAKTGMLYSAALAREAARFFKGHPRIPLVVDPVMISTSGRRLLQLDGVKILQEQLLPLARIVTPNLAEAEILAGGKIRTLEELRAAAGAIYRRYGCAALVKGGHLAGTAEAADFFYGPEGEWMISAPRLKVAGLHGTGCVYSAAVTAGLARGMTGLQSVRLAKRYITSRIEEMQSRNKMNEAK
jgi:hydroxymethylpyrimidine/phosphomethylpyrimidine kinase